MEQVSLKVDIDDVKQLKEALDNVMCSGVEGPYDDVVYALLQVITPACDGHDRQLRWEEEAAERAQARIEKGEVQTLAEWRISRIARGGQG